MHDFAMARKLHQQRMYAYAIPFADNAVLANPASYAAHCIRGCILHGLNRFEDALEAHNTSILLKPNNAQAHSGLAIVLEKLGRYSEALQHWKLARKADPSDIVAPTKINKLTHRIRFHSRA